MKREGGKRKGNEQRGKRSKKVKNNQPIARQKVK